jgi:hypothetical protein
VLRGANMGFEVVVKSKILSHFIKGRELEYLEGLVKLARKRKDAEGQRNQIATIQLTLAIRRVTSTKQIVAKHCI